MSEYVSREDAVKAIRERCSPCGEAIEAIRDAPTVDAVVVTRCKNCKYCTQFADSEMIILCEKHDIIMPCDGFCSYGEPKETPHADDHN